jgi:ADP-ribose pyrophosphatase YjhB (NUDIX family)
MPGSDNPLSDFDREGVWLVPACQLRATHARWAYAEARSREIEDNWIVEKTSNPNYFNGPIHLIHRLAMADNAIRAELLRTDFKSSLYWRREGFPEASVIDGFGSAIVRSADSAIILGRQRAGNINAGLSYPPGGFIDDRDVADDGTIDIEKSIRRELAEETGLDPSALERGHGYWITRSGAQLSIAVPFRSKLNTADLMRAIQCHIAASPNSELEAAVAVSHASDLERLEMPHYTRRLLDALFAET